MSELLEAARNGETVQRLRIIDMHGHLGVYAFAIPDIGPASLVAAMDRVGIASVVVSHMQCMGSDVERGNADVCAAMRAFPGRILGYCSLWAGAGALRVGREAEKCLAAGFTGLKIHNANGFPYTDPSYNPAYALADHHRLPMLFHTWGDEREFAQIKELAMRYPNATFLLAHGGCTNEAGYAEMVRLCSNVYLDLAYSAAPAGLVERLVENVGAGRIIWGSDVYFFNQAQQIGKVMGARIPEEDKRKILSTNALNVLSRIRNGPAEKEVTT